MLREVGKRDKSKEISFLDKHHKTMPRVMLRYAIERLSKEQRIQYLAA
jgi:3-methyladenine DNA glycosylase AlkD